MTFSIAEQVCMLVCVRVRLRVNDVFLIFLLNQFMIFLRYLHQVLKPGDLTPQLKPSYPYQTVGCVFNHKALFANCQSTDSVQLCVFDLQDKCCWKAMSEEALNSVCAPGSITFLPPVPTLCPSSLDAALASNQMELELRHLLAEHRKVGSSQKNYAECCVKKRVIFKGAIHKVLLE